MTTVQVKLAILVKFWKNFTFRTYVQVKLAILVKFWKNVTFRTYVQVKLAILVKFWENVTLCGQDCGIEETRGSHRFDRTGCFVEQSPWFRRIVYTPVSEPPVHAIRKNSGMFVSGCITSLDRSAPKWMSRREREGLCRRCCCYCCCWLDSFFGARNRRTRAWSSEYQGHRAKGYRYLPLSRNEMLD